MNRTWITILLVAAVIGAAWYFNGQNTMLADYRDGNYVGESAPDDRGQYGRVELTVESGEITAVEYTEIGSDGEPKGEDYPYPPLFEAIAEYESRLIETQDPDDVDNVSGASGTWELFKDAANNALESAQKALGMSKQMSGINLI